MLWKLIKDVAAKDVAAALDREMHLVSLQRLAVLQDQNKEQQDVIGQLKQQLGVCLSVDDDKEQQLVAQGERVRELAQKLEDASGWKRELMELQQQHRILQEDLRLTRMAHATMTRDNDGLREELGGVQVMGGVIGRRGHDE